MSPRPTTTAAALGRALPDYPGRQLLEGVLAPVVRPVAAHLAGQSVQRLLGFFLLWHSYGGFEGLLASRVISRAGIYAQRREFAEVFGVDVDEFLPEVATALTVCKLAAAALPADAPAPAGTAPSVAGQLELA